VEKIGAEARNFKRKRKGGFSWSGPGDKTGIGII
jgi:hypothetical protein